MVAGKLVLGFFPYRYFQLYVSGRQISVLAYGVDPVWPLDGYLRAVGGDFIELGS